LPEKIITLYCFFAELLSSLGHKDDPQAILTDAEIMTVAAVAAEFFVGNHQASLNFLSSHGYIKPFSKSRFCRRLQAIAESRWQLALWILAQAHQSINLDNYHIVDTFPVPVCRNIRTFRCRIYSGKIYRGWSATKKEYFFGMKVCLVVTEQGYPVEFHLSPASTADMAALRSMELDLPKTATIFGDKGFLDQKFEAELAEQMGIRLVVPRRKNMKEQLEGCIGYICKVVRKRVETTFSQIAERLARSVHAVTPAGFERKIMLTVLVFSILG
jgi:IS5 family transposase